MLYGVDVHDGYQAGLSFPLLRQQGYSFAAVKLTQGTGYARDLGDDWVRAARAAGLIPGGYHWLTAGNGAAQARWFHRKVVESGGPDGMLIQLDCEDTAGYADVLDWRDEWNRLTGGHPFLLYTGAWWWQPRGWSGTTVTPYLWHSRYLSADADTVPDDVAAFAARIPASWWQPGYGGWDQVSILQFTSRGDAGSLGNNVDLNATRLTREQLLALTRPGAASTTGGNDMGTLEGIQAVQLNNIERYLQALFAGGPAQNISNNTATPVPPVPNSVAVVLGAIASKVDIDPGELEAIKQASAAGAAAAFNAGVPVLVDALFAKLPPGAMTRDELVAAMDDAVRHAFAGGLAPAAPKAP